MTDNRQDIVPDVFLFQWQIFMYQCSVIKLHSNGQSYFRLVSHLHGCLGDCASSLLVEPLKALLQRVHLLEVEPRRLNDQIELGVVLSVGDHLYALVGGVGDLEGDEQRLELTDF